MKKFRKIAALLLSLTMVFVLAGCGGSKSGKNMTPLENEEETTGETSHGGKGRFMESEIKLPEGIDVISAMGKLSDGSIELLGSSTQTGMNYILTSKDAGENWESKELEGLGDSYISNTAISPDGTVALFGYYDGGESMKVGLKIASKDGQVRDVDFQLPEREGVENAVIIDDLADGETAGMEESTVIISGTENGETVGVEESTVIMSVTEDGETAGVEESTTVVDGTEDAIIMDNTENMVIQAGFDKEGNLIISDINCEFYSVDIMTGEVSKCCDMQGEQAEFFGIAGNRLLAVTSNGIRIFNTTDKSEVEKDAILDDVVKSMGSSLGTIGEFPVVFTEGMEENSVIYANHEGIFYHMENGSVSECVVNGELTSLSDTSMGLSGVLMIDEKNYLVSCVDTVTNSKLFKYTYDENVSAVPEKQIKVYALEDSNLLRQTVSNFQASHPEVFVKVEIGMSGDSGVTAEDALQALNTNILAGKGPDILILDGMPVESYIEKGVLADMKNLLNEIDQTDGLFTNIKEAYQEGENIYCMPVRFSVPVVEGSTQAVAAGNTLENLLNYGKTLKTEGGIGVFPKLGDTGLLEELFRADSSNWKKEDGSIEEDKLKNFLQNVKEMKDLDGYAVDEINYMYTSEGMFLGTAGNNSVSRLLKENQIAFGTLGSFSDLGNIFGIEKQISGTYDLMNSGDSKTFVPYLTTGIAKGKEENEEVREFVKMLFGKECGSASENGFPVNKAAYEMLYQAQAAEGEEEEISSGAVIMTEDGTMVSYSTEPISESNFQELTKKIESLETPMITDQIIHDLVIEEGEKYLNHEQSLEDAVSTIMQKVNLYLSE